MKANLLRSMVAMAAAALGPACAAAAEPLEFTVGSRWRLTMHGLHEPRSAPSWAPLAATPGLHEARAGWRGPLAPTSRLTIDLRGGYATLTRGPEATAHLQAWSYWHLSPPDWHFDGESAGDPRVARRRLRQALVGLLKAAAGSDAPSAFEIGTDTTRQVVYGGLAAFPRGGASLRSFGLDQASLRLASSGDGHLVLGRAIGRDAFLTVASGLGGSGSHARFQYRIAPWLELRAQAGSDTRIVEILAAVPLR
jgi:hypothetical protein